MPVVTLSINDNVKFLANTNRGFKKTFSCNKYTIEINRGILIDLFCFHSQMVTMILLTSITCC